MHKTKQTSRCNQDSIADKVHAMNTETTLGGRQPAWATGPPIQAASKSYPPSPFIIIIQPKILYSFYHPTEGRRLSQPR